MEELLELVKSKIKNREEIEIELLGLITMSLEKYVEQDKRIQEIVHSGMTQAEMLNTIQKTQSEVADKLCIIKYMFKDIPASHEDITRPITHRHFKEEA